MLQQLTSRLGSRLRAMLRVWVAIALVVTLVFGSAQAANAASGMGGGRISGGSFRAPSRSYSAPSRSYSSPRSSYGGSYGGGYGGGFGMPFFLPFFGGFGMGGGLLTLMLVIVVANFLMQALRSSGATDSLTGEVASSNPTVSVAKLQVGLLAQAQQLKTDLNKLALKADTATTAGLANVLQESTLALLRHPEYWVYAGESVEQTRLGSAENQFNRLALMERSKFGKETLSNVNNQLKQAQAANTAIAVPEAGGSLATQSEQPAPYSGEYIVVTLLVATEGKLNLPKITGSSELRQALQQLGGVASDRLLALEVLWTPQADGDILTSDDMLAEYPNLKLI